MDGHTLAVAAIYESGTLRVIGLPAVSGDGASIAVPSSESSVGGLDQIRIVRLADGGTLDTLRLQWTSDDKVFGIDAQRAFLAEVTRDANAYLRAGAFRPMTALYQLPARNDAGADAAWIHVDGRWRIAFDFESEKVTLTEADSGRLRLAMQRPWRVFGYIRQVDALCAVRGLPQQGWIDEASGAVVFQVINDLFGHHYCSPPDDWVVHALNEASALIDMPGQIALPLTIQLSAQAAGEAPQPVANAAVQVKVGEALRLNASAPEGVESIHFWSLAKRPPLSGAMVFDATSPRENSRQGFFIADRPGSYLIEVYVISGDHRSAPVHLRVEAEGELLASAAIGPEGGAVGLPDGASVLVPPGALQETIDIAIALLQVGADVGVAEPDGLVGPLYDITPDDQSFLKAVQIIAPFDPNQLEPGVQPSDIVMGRRGADGSFGRVGAGADHRDSCCVEVDAERRLVTFFVWDF